MDSANWRISCLVQPALWAAFSAQPSNVSKAGQGSRSARVVSGWCWRWAAGTKPRTGCVTEKFQLGLARNPPRVLYVSAAMDSSMSLWREVADVTVVRSSRRPMTGSQELCCIPSLPDAIPSREPSAGQREALFFWQKTALPSWGENVQA